jgi:hypothetical protein
MLLHLLGISNQSSFQPFPMDFMFSFENGPDIEVVSNASKYLKRYP